MAHIQITYICFTVLQDLEFLLYFSDKNNEDSHDSSKQTPPRNHINTARVTESPETLKQQPDTNTTQTGQRSQGS